MVYRAWPTIGLVFFLVAGLLATVPSAEGHPLHLQLENSVVVLSNRIDAGRWVAQSFLPNTSFFISRVSLYVIDEGENDFLAVSVRDDAFGFPDGTNLTGGSADGPAVGTWVDFDLDPYVQLVANQPYWIVAHSSMPQGAGYEWWNSGSDLAYPNGTGAESDDGSTWSYPLLDFSFRVYGFQQPSFVFSVSVGPSALGPLESTVFRVNFTNQGLGESAGLWVNVSFPGELKYVTDDADSIGGVRSGAYSFEFDAVAPGSFSFNITASANGGVPDGTVATTNFNFEAQDHNGASLTPSAQDKPVTIKNARLALSLTSRPSLVDPGDTILLNATVVNLGSEAAQNLLVEALVDPNATYISSTPSGTFDTASRALRWTRPLLDPGSETSFEWMAEVNLGTPDLATVSSLVRVDYEDISATRLPSVNTSSQSSVQAPAFAPRVWLDRPTAERGEEVTATLHYNNTGSATALQAWANWTLGGHYELVDLTPALPYTTTVEGFSVDLASVAQGSHSLVARLRIIRGLADGLAMGLQVAWKATDGNGNALPTQVLFSEVELHAPLLALTLSGETDRVESSSIFVLSLTLRNTGRAPGRGWLNLTLPSGVEYVGDNGTFAVAVADDRVTWTLLSLPAGSVIGLGVELLAKGETGLASFRFALSFTDGKGSPPQVAFSNAVSVEFLPASSTILGLPWWFLILLAAAIPGAAYPLIRRWRSRKAKVEEVFVVDSGGLLVAHLSSSIVQVKDEDLVVAMFTAIQEYVRNVFSRGSEEEMRGLDFGERHILIEGGQHHYVAVVYRGKDLGELEERVRDASREIDERFGADLAGWSGDVEEVEDIASVLPQIWGGKP
ncbi:MAG: hypothetical protein ACE5KQ_02700 [Thermoplasmata archaeon]